MLFLGNGVQHEVYTKGDGKESYGFVRKFPSFRNDIDAENVASSIKFFREKFPDFVLPTRLYTGGILCNGEATKYVVIQKRVDGKALNVCREDELSLEVLEQMLRFLDAYEQVFVQEGVNFDLMGYQNEILYQRGLQKAQLLKKVKAYIAWLPIGLKQSGFFLYLLLLYLDRFLFPPDIFSSSNLMIDVQKQKLYFTDNVTEISQANPRTRSGKFVQSFYRKFLVGHFRKQIKHLLASKS